MESCEGSVTYESALRQHYQSVSDRLRLAPARRIAPPREVEQLPPPIVAVAPKPALSHRLHITAIEEIDPVPLTWRQIVDQVCGKHGITFMQITAHIRTKDIVRARQEAMYRLHQERALSWAEIGRLLGRFDHTTILHGTRMHAGRINGDIRQSKKSALWTDDMKRTALAMRSDGKSNTEIAGALGLSRKQVCNLVPRLAKKTAPSSKERLRRLAAAVQA